MFKPVATRFLQHILNQNLWAKPHLLPFAGKIILFDFSVIRLPVLVLEDGSLSMAGETTQADASVFIPPSLAMRLLSQDETAKSFIKIEGDTHLATEVSKILQAIRWDIEEDMSRVVGDIAAYKITEVSQNTLSQIKKQGSNLADMLSEYWQEEKNILAKKNQIESFNQAVDVLKSDADRLEKRLEKLIKKQS